ncbi:hypothetical protein [Bacillus sp. FJAT-47783]|uniref:hypothetical protein n=1 Tax=Bacillus sp. FJAT-47783 TaxID=2922712 RepID=UPI001FAD17BF|nr:hypothetical protein [Bacillus sp. FJAT-47783]
MDNSFGDNSKPIFLTAILFLTAAIFLFLPREVKGTNLWIAVTIYAIIDIGFLVAMIWGIRTKSKAIVVFSVLANSVLFIGVTIFIFLLLATIGIAGPFIILTKNTGTIPV